MVEIFGNVIVKVVFKINFILFFSRNEKFSLMLNR